MMRSVLCAKWKLKSLLCSRRFSQSAPSSSPHHSQGEPSSDFLLLCFRGGLAAGWVYALTEYATDITLCEGPSMDPTLHSSGEIIWMDKWAVRRHPLPTGNERAQQAQSRQQNKKQQHQQDEFWYEPRIPVNELQNYSWADAWRNLRSPLSVGDVVVIQHPSRKGTVCKRVVGLPGDQVLRNNVTQRRQQQLFTVPDGHIWLEGDNPANSSDSRDYGAVPAQLLVGRVIARIWPSVSWMRRGAPPLRPNCGGASTVLPAGYQGQPIQKSARQG